MPSTQVLLHVVHHCSSHHLCSYHTGERHVCRADTSRGEGPGTGLGHGRAAPERSSSGSPTCRGTWMGIGTGVTQKSGATLEAGGCRSGAGAADAACLGTEVGHGA